MVTHWRMIWERVLVRQDALIRGLDILGLKRRLAYEKCVHNDTSRPHVHLERMTFLALENLGSNIVGRSAYGLFAFIGRRQPRGEAKVPHLDPHVAVNKQIAELQVAVDDQVRVEVLEGAY